MSDKTRVRVTQEPEVVREVDEAEFTDLSRQGLIHSHNRGDGSSPNDWEPAKKNDEIVEQPPAITDTMADAPAPASKKKGA